MADVTFQVTGTADIIAKMNQVVRSINSQTNKAIETAVNSTYDGSQVVVPVDTGDLKASGKKQVSDLQGSVSYGTDHAWFPELGTINQRAQPYLYPPFERASRQFINDLKDMTP